MAQYNSTHTGQEIDNGVSKALNPDATPTSGSDNLVKSGGVYNALAGKAPTDHASSGTAYGIGTGDEYGHVLLSDSHTSQSGENGGVAATPAAVKDAYDLADSKYLKPAGGIPASDMASGAIPSPSSATPNMDGTGAAGSSTDYSRADHVHPSDTSKADADDVADIAEDVDDLKSAITNVENTKAPVIIDSASGAIASFPDGAAGMPVKSIVINIDPVQSGTGDPSPTNVRPISGWTGCNVTRTGKNLYVGKIENYYIDSTGHFMIAPGNYDVAIAPVVKGETYTVKIDYSSLVIGFFTAYPTTESVTYNGARTDSASFTFASPINGYAGIRIRHGYSTPQMEVGSVSTEYEAPISTTIPISWQTEAGTVYGGTLDVTSGVLTVTDANIASYNGETLPGEWISDRDVYAAGTTPTTGAQVVYKLVTPQTYQLTPTEVTTLLGQNNIWADTGDSTVEYPADTKLYIQKINTPTDDDMIADANIASGKYFIVNNNLYLSTAAILAGDPIKPGTNCTLTNLAAALNALNS